MKLNHKYFLTITVLILLAFVLSACTSPGDTDFSRTYDLSLEVAGEGSIRDAGRNRFITSSSRTLELNRNTIIELEAEPGIENDFLFWVGDFDELAGKPTQNIYMDNNKELIAVFGDLNNIFMGGNITEAWSHSNVIGYWKALIDHEDLEEDEFDEGLLELYVRETSGTQRKYRYIFDKEVFANNSGEIVYKRATDEEDIDLANFEYIAAIIRVEENNYLDQRELDRYMFVFSNTSYIEILILPDNPDYKEIYEDTLEFSSNSEQFKEEVRKIIFEYKNEEEYLRGKTFEVNDPFETQ